MSDRFAFGTIVFLLGAFGLGLLLHRLLSRDAFVIVREWEHGLLYRDGRFERVLPPGRYRTLSLIEKREIHKLPKHPQILVTPPVDAMSADRLPLRLSATVRYRVTDPREVLQGSPEPLIRLAVSSALVALASGRTIDALLADRAKLDEEILGGLASPIGGCTIEGVTLTGLTLPPEIRRMISEAERARLEGLAALERARGEHAALRSLANAARMLKGNPELMNLRVLQALAAPGSRGQSMLVMSPTGLVPVPAESVGDAPSG